VPKNKTTKSRVRSTAKGKSASPEAKIQGSSSGAAYSALKKRFDAQAQELRSALEREAATSRILRVIATASTKLQTVMDTIAENAARLCEADDVLVRQTDVLATKPYPILGRSRIVVIKFLWTSAAGLGERF